MEKPKEQIEIQTLTVCDEKSFNQGANELLGGGFELFSFHTPMSLKETVDTDNEYSYGFYYVGVFIKYYKPE